MAVNAEDTVWFSRDQHCTFPDQNGEDDYSFSHTAGYCGRPQKRFCGCAFDYAEGFAVEANQIVSEAESVAEANRKLTKFVDDAREEEDRLNWSDDY